MKALPLGSSRGAPHVRVACPGTRYLGAAKGRVRLHRSTVPANSPTPRRLHLLTSKSQGHRSRQLPAQGLTSDQP